MKVLIVGGGGREHALAWRLSLSGDAELFSAPGNPGIESVAKCIPASSVDDYLQVAEKIGIDLTVVGPEAPLVAGIVDRFRAAGRLIVGPTAAAAQLEGSKSFSKAFMVRAGIPTARFVLAEGLDEARQALASFDFPVVLKADGLAAGKGVAIVQDIAEAEAALLNLAGSKLVIEEFLQGEEVSFIVISDGTHILPLEPSQDHKTIYDDDKGPNTGGMGVYCDGRILSEAQKAEILDRIIEPTIATMAREGTPFTGFLYAGLMMTAAGPKVLEFNARLGDPETQAILHRLEGGFLEALMASARASGIAAVKLQWKPEPSVCVVLAAHGYPASVRTGDRITGIEDAQAKGAVVFQAGTRRDSGDLVTAGGRVLGVTASGEDLSSAIKKTYASAAEIRFDGMQLRHDIGSKGLKRWKEISTA